MRVGGGACRLVLSSALQSARRRPPAVASARAMAAAAAAAGDKPIVVVTNASVNVAKLKEVATVRQFGGEGVMPRKRLLTEIADASGLFCLLTDRVDRELLDAAGDKLRAIGTMSVGYEHIDMAACRERSIKVGYTPGILTEATAELGVALLLATARRLVKAADAARAVHGATVGIYGSGAIGASVAEKLAAFRPARILYHNRRQRSDVPYEFVSFATLLAESDFLVVSATASAANARVFNADAFAQMKRSAILINISLGSLVETAALRAALRDGTIAAAGVDTVGVEPPPPSNELYTHTNCIVLPHIGSATSATRAAMAARTVDNLYEALSGRAMISAVDE